MRRLFWLAAGPLLVLAIGLALWFGPPPEDKLPAKSGRDVLVLPSGLQAEFHEMLWNQPGEGLTYRFRFIAPAFEQADDVEKVMADLQYLCSEFVLSKLSNTGPRPGQVIISLADAASEFGTYSPDVTQVFEAFDVSDGVCIWEEF